MKLRIELLAIIVIFVMISSMLFFFDSIKNTLSLAVYSSLVPYDIVFDPSVDKSQIDASQIINCLHGGGCPAGITYINDETGLKEERPVIPNQQQPVPNFAPETKDVIPNNVPVTVQLSVVKADMVVYFLYGLIIVSLVGLAALILKKKKMKNLVK